MTQTLIPDNATKLQLLRQLFATATCDASAAMCRWTGSPITLTVDEVVEIPLGEACVAYNLGDEPLTMVVLVLDGELGGAMMLAFDEPAARRLAATLLQAEPAAGPEWTEMETSALTETGNILGCAYINALTRLIDRQLVPSIPYFVEDYAASVLQQALVTQASGRDSVLVCRTGFHCQNEDLSWRVMFIPSVALRTAMEQALYAS
jgi:chemotaxis protein CheC